jgi:hypothetical protein
LAAGCPRAADTIGDRERIRGSFVASPSDVTVGTHKDQRSFIESANGWIGDAHDVERHTALLEGEGK